MGSALRRGEQPRPVKRGTKNKKQKRRQIHDSPLTVSLDLNRAGEDHPQRPEAVAESVTQTGMDVDEPVTVTVTTKPTPRVILDGEWTLISI